MSIADVAANPKDPMAWAGLAGDILDLAVPCVSGVGEITRGFNSANRIAQCGDAVSDAAKVAKRADFYVTPMGDAIPASRKVFDNNLSMLDNVNGKYYGVDSNGPVRIRVEQHKPTVGYNGPNNPYHCEPHFHVDRRQNGSSGPFRKVFSGLMEWLT